MDERYNEVLRKATEYYKKVGQEFKGLLRDLFPELKNCDDDEIREGLINGLKDCKEEYGWSDFGGIYIDNAIEWLEAKGKSHKEALNEQSVNERTVIPLFKVGDRVVSTSPIECDSSACGKVYRIEEVNNTNYIAVDNDGNRVHISFEKQNLLQPFREYVTSCDSYNENLPEPTHYWEDGDIVRLRQDDGKRWQIAKSKYAEQYKEWFLCELRDNSIAGGWVSEFLLDSNYVFVNNPLKEAEKNSFDQITNVYIHA